MPKSLVPNQFDYAGIYVEGTRSVFRFHKPILDSAMSGMLVPAGDPIPIFPGVKTNLKMNMVIRSNTMVIPPLDGIYIDCFAVWVPHRIVWTHEAQFLGQNDTTAWTQSSTYIYPSVYADTIINPLQAIITDSSFQGDVVAGNNFLWTHYGFGSSTAITSSDAIYHKLVSVLAPRGYYFIWNHYFRDENYQRPVLFDKGDTGSVGEFGYLVRDYSTDSTNSISDIANINIGNYGYALLMPVNKFHDAFTSVLPQPQFGNAVEIATAETVPVTADSTNMYDLGSKLKFGPMTASRNSFLGISSTDNGVFVYDSGTATTATSLVTKSNLVVDLSNTSLLTINNLRTSVMYQRYLEALARGGRRMVEYFESIYSVKNSAAAKDYPEMLSHSRYMLGVNQVVATADSSGSGWTSHLGDTGAYSLTNLKNIPLSQKDFSEFGYLHILYCIRADNRYSQAVPAHFFRSTLLDEYNPYFDHIGDVAVPNYLVNINASSAGNFGYQEAWWDERTQVPMALSALNKSYGSLAYWTLGEVNSTTLVTCTPQFLCFDPEVFNDVFVSAYYTYPQFIVDILIHGTMNKKMSAHSIPGIVGRI